MSRNLCVCVCVPVNAAYVWSVLMVAVLSPTFWRVNAICNTARRALIVCFMPHLPFRVSPSSGTSITLAVAWESTRELRCWTVAAASAGLTVTLPSSRVRTSLASLSTSTRYGPYLTMQPRVRDGMVVLSPCLRLITRMQVGG